MRRVVKLGGSLLIRHDLVDRLRDWYATETPAETLLVVGGGELIDAIRRLDRVRPNNPVEVHWRCVDMLQATFATVREWFPDWDSICSAEQFYEHSRRGFAVERPTIVSVGAFYHRDGNAGLPEDWRTTTDAIAAFLAHRVGAQELLLLKSCQVDRSADATKLADQGIVDPAFPIAANGLPKVNVRRL